MVQPERTTPTSAGIDWATSGVSAASKNLQALAGEMAEMSKQSLEHATQVLEKLRNARSVDEVLAIQTSFLREAFEQTAQRTRRFSELMTSLPLEVTKTYQEAMTKCVDAAMHATETASQTAATNAERFSDAVRKS